MTDLRGRISAALKQAMKDKNADRLSTLRLINAAIKDKDIDARAAGQDDGVGEGEVLQILGKMVKQRRESARTYEEGGRLDLAEREEAEIVVIEEFLPQKLDDDAAAAAVDAAISEVGADSIRDMGKVMGLANKELAGKADGKTISTIVKKQLS